MLIYQHKHHLHYYYFISVHRLWKKWDGVAEMNVGGFANFISYFVVEELKSVTCYHFCCVILCHLNCKM